MCPAKASNSSSIKARATSSIWLALCTRFRSTSSLDALYLIPIQLHCFGSGVLQIFELAVSGGVYEVNTQTNRDKA
eukprot:666594-Pelagomonas_calceolata.AAC.1